MSASGTEGLSRQPPAELTVERIDSPEGVEALREDWNRLQDGCPSKHVLLDHRCVTAWLHHFGDGKEIHFLAGRRDGRIAGIAPLMLTRGWEAFPARDSRFHIAEDHVHLRVPRWRRVVPIRRVTFPFNIPSQNGRMHFLLEDDSPEFHEAILRYWAERADRWDLMVLEGLPVDSPQPEGIREAAGRCSLRTLPHGRFITLYSAELGASLDEFLKSRNHHFRTRLRADLRASARAGKIEFDEYRKGDIATGLDLLFAIERQTWKARGVKANSVFLPLDNRIRGFLLEVGRAFAQTDDAQVLAMKVNGEPVGGLFSLSRQDIILTMVIYIADAWLRKISSAPLWVEFFELAIGRGIVKIDFNANTLNARKWSNGSATFRRLYLFHPGMYSLLLGCAKSSATWLSRRLRGAGKKEKGGHD